MPTEDKKKLLLVATTPSLGARLWIQRDATNGSDRVCLHIGNEGGRGTARYLVLLPVNRLSATLLDPVLRPCEFRGSPRGDPNGPWQRHLQSPPATLPTPTSRRYSGDAWRAMSRGEPWMLVLVLFADPKTPQPPNNDYTDDDLVAALESFFARQPQPAHLLRRGLLYLAEADVPAPPSSAPSPAPGPAPGPVLAPAMTARATEPAAQPFTFALASCQYPAGLVDGTPQAFGHGDSHGDGQGEGQTMPPGPADASMLRLAARLVDPNDHCRPSLLVLTGDQIYADATAGLFDPRAGRVPAPRSSLRDAEHWLSVPYQKWYGSVGAQSVLGRRGCGRFLGLLGG